MNKKISIILLCLFIGNVFILHNDDALAQEERPAMIRFTIGTHGLGTVQCGSCSTATGCEGVWIKAGTSIACQATPAPNYKFLHWTANGNFAGDKPVIHFGQKGATLQGHFGQ